MGDNITCFSVAYDCLESYSAFNHEKLGYIARIFEDTYDSIFRLWGIHSYKEVIYFNKKIYVCGMDDI